MDKNNTDTNNINGNDDITDQNGKILHSTAIKDIGDAGLDTVSDQETVTGDTNVASNDDGENTVIEQKTKRYNNFQIVQADCLRIEQKIRVQEDKLRDIQEVLTGIVEKLSLLTPPTNETPLRDCTTSRPTTTTLTSSFSTTNPLDTSLMLNAEKRNVDIIQRGSYPKYDNGQTVTMFLLSTVLKYCQNRSLSVAHVKKWIHLCFDQSKQLKIEYFVDTISGCSDLKNFLIELSRKLDNYTGKIPEATATLKPTEGIVDYFLRIQVELKGLKTPENNIPTEAITLLLKNSKDPILLCEARRIFVPMMETGHITIDALIEQAILLDSILDRGNIKAADDKISRISSAKYDPKAKMDNSEFATCKECYDKHFEKNTSGQYYAHCRNCFLKIILDDNRLKQVRYDLQTGRPTYFTPKYEKYLPYPENFLGKKDLSKFVPFGRHGIKFKYPPRLLVRPPYSLKASDAPEKRKSQAKYDSKSKKDFPKFKPRPLKIKNWSEISSQKTNSEPETQKISSVMELKKVMDDKQKRICVEVAVNGATCMALIDNGSDASIMTLNYLKKARLQGKLDNEKRALIAFDGSKIETLGNVQTTMKVGEENYNGTFKVVSTPTADYQVILGTDFLGHFGILQELKRKLTKKFGKNQVHNEV